MSARRAGAVGVALMLLLAACTTDADTGPNGEEDGPVVALLLPESKTTRYESIDRPVFEEAIERECPECTVVYANAGQDSARQQQQAESALTQGADVLVLGAVDSAAAASIVTAADQRGVSVIAYDRAIAGAPVDFLVTYDAREVGRLQGEALVEAVGPTGPDEGVLLVHGSATDPNVAKMKDGLADALEGSGLRVLAEYDTPDWSPDKAQEWVESQLTEYAGQVVGVYAANDGTAGGAISAMRAAGLDPVPPVTGQDAELAAVQRIISGDQYMTVYKRIALEASTAARVAVELIEGIEPIAYTTVDGVPAVLLIPVAVTRHDVASIIVDGGVHTVEDLCVAPYADDCAELGLEEER